jgi:hypothetical protein
MRSAPYSLSCWMRFGLRHRSAGSPEQPRGHPPAPGFPPPRWLGRGQFAAARDRVGHAVLGLDTDETGVDDPALRGAEERVAGRENQRVEAARLDDAPVAVVDDLVREHAVLEGPVGELEGDEVARFEAVDIAEGRAEGCPVTGDGGHPVESRERCLLVVARPTRKVGTPPRSVDEHGAEVEVGDLDPPDRVTELEAGLEPPGVRGEILVDRREVSVDDARRRRRVRDPELRERIVERAGELMLLPALVDIGDGVAPEIDRGAVREEEDAEDDDRRP